MINTLLLVLLVVSMYAIWWVLHDIKIELRYRNHLEELKKSNHGK